MGSSQSQPSGAPKSAATHTPGPWIIEPKTARGNWLCNADGDYVAMVCVVNRSAAEEDANARLVAAAPELLGALRAAQRLCAEALPKFDWGKSSLDGNAIGLLNEVPGVIAAAIAKATSQETTSLDDGSSRTATKANSGLNTINEVSQ